MLTPAKRLKEQLANGDTVVGVLATDHIWPTLVELCKEGGLDYLVIDREHGPHTDEAVAQVCQMARVMDFPALMRTVSCEMMELRRAIDLGPCGLILPCIESAEQLDAVRDAIQMPPRGKRRPGGMGKYWMRNVHYETWRDEFEEHFIVVPQIETKAGIENVDAIASHPITTALGLGPYDLSADLGCCWNPDDPAHKEAVTTIRKAADRAGKKLWMAGDPAQRRAEGYTFLWFGTVSSVLTKGFAANVEAAKKAAS